MYLYMAANSNFFLIYVYFYTYLFINYISKKIIYNNFVYWIFTRYTCICVYIHLHVFDIYKYIKIIIPFVKSYHVLFYNLNLICCNNFKHCMYTIHVVYVCTYLCTLVYIHIEYTLCVYCFNCMNFILILCIQIEWYKIWCTGCVIKRSCQKLCETIVNVHILYMLIYIGNNTFV